jgi:hypothetical protein
MAYAVKYRLLILFGLFILVLSQIFIVMAVSSCTDPDGMDNKTKSIVTVITNGKTKEYTDSCDKSGSHLKEYYCKNNKKAQKIIRCNCIDGRCTDYDFIKKTIDKNKEYQFYMNGSHFISIIMHTGAISIRPHPGEDINGWGSSLYLQPFLAKATLKNTKITSITGFDDRIEIRMFGKVSRGKSKNYGKWNSTLIFRFDKVNHKIIGTGNYNILLSDLLDNSDEDLNLCKIASNYLDDVPLLNGSVGDTGDMKRADVVGDNFTFTWIPEDQPAHFPTDLKTRFLSIDVVGDYNQVDTAKQGYAPIAAAVKPNIKISLNSTNPSTLMVFGGIYTLKESKQYWSDNVGITPLILKSSSDKQFNFDITFESTEV